jgi:hypothetical protein
MQKQLATEEDIKKSSNAGGFAYKLKTLVPCALVIKTLLLWKDSQHQSEK